MFVANVDTIYNIGILYYPIFICNIVFSNTYNSNTLKSLTRIKYMNNICALMVANIYII